MLDTLLIHTRSVPPPTTGTLLNATVVNKILLQSRYVYFSMELSTFFK